MQKLMRVFRPVKIERKAPGALTENEKNLRLLREPRTKLERQKNLLTAKVATDAADDGKGKGTHERSKEPGPPGPAVEMEEW